MASSIEPGSESSDPDERPPSRSATDASEAMDAVARAGRRVTDSGYGRYAGVGLQYAATLGLFAWGGHALDARLDSSPWLLLVGVLLGFAGGTISLIRKVPPVRSRGTASGMGAKDPEAAEPSDSERPPSA